jgi:tetratricopeptide (TPR) repeat protein
MKHSSKLYLSVALASGVLLTSCNNLGELSAEYFTVTPSPLEEVAGQVPATINGRFPEKYMKKKAVVTVTPVLRYEGGETAGHPATFQGEKVQGNDQEISYKVGGNYTMKSTFNYVDAMAKSELYLTFDARVGNKVVEIPAVKVADGVVATSTLIKKTAYTSTPAIAQDAYQYAIAQSQQAQIKYLINQANIRTSELKSVSVQDLVKVLREIKNDQKNFQLDKIEISAYASPEGSLKFNTALAEKRQNSSAEFLKGELKNLELDANIDTKYTAEDWEGFQELLMASNLQDKEVILRVLSMYEDPEERETKIRELSAGFQELATEILPELRRARLTVNYNLIGRSDDEIMAQYKEDAKALSVEELLYAATLTEKVAEKKEIYTTTANTYPADYRAYNNLATIALAEGNLEQAKNYLKQAASKNDCAEVNANFALVALAEGNVKDAETYVSRATSAPNYNELVGNLNVAKGNFAAAAQNLKGAKTNSTALAEILTKNYTEAEKTLANVKKADAMTDYLKAVLAARTGKANEAVKHLKNAIQKEPSLKEHAAKNLDFVTLFNDNAFLNLVK